MRVLIVEDEVRLARTLRTGLEEEGFGVDVVADGRTAVAAAQATDFDLVTLDVMLPGGFDGFRVCTELRGRRLGVPVLILTARDAVGDRVRGLDAGADDYLVKPFELVELQARVRALIRRAAGNAVSTIVIGDVVIDTAARLVSQAGHSINLTSREYA